MLHAHGAEWRAIITSPLLSLGNAVRFHTTGKEATSTHPAANNAQVYFKHGHFW